MTIFLKKEGPKGLTVWKFHNFPITDSLREIKFADCRSAKSDILTHLEVLNFESYDFFLLLEG